MKTIVTICILIVFIGCKKDPQATVQPAIDSPIISIPVIDSIKSPIVGLEIGNKAPEISLPDTSGNIISLSSFKGKIVLIDFWASWCSPCIVENRNLTLLYPHYNDTIFQNASGYEIFSVSTDAIRLMWLNKLNYEQFSWKYNVRDTSSAFSQLYKVSGIPTNFLIDGNGIILAKNLRGTKVEDTLKTLLKK